MENKEKQRYLPMRDANDPHKVTLIPVTEDVYAEVSRETNRIRSRRQYHGQCCCPKQYIWKCDANCDLCEYRAAVDNLSLDYETEMHGDTFADTSNTEEIVTDQMLMHQLLARLEELMPEALAVGQKIVDEDLSERKVLEQLDLKRSTYRSQLEKARKQLESEFGKIF